MDTKAAAGATGNRLYEDFEPSCKWHSEEGQDILSIVLKGFKKEQLKVQADNRGMLAIYGERPLDASKWCRFRKEFTLPKDCISSHEIRAKFSQMNGILSIVIPKKVQPLTKETENKTKGVTATSSEAGSEQKLGLDKGSVWGVKISKRRAIKVAAVVVVVVMVVAIGTQIAQLLHRHPHHAATVDHVVNV